MSQMEVDPDSIERQDFGSAVDSSRIRRQESPKKIEYKKLKIQPTLDLCREQLVSILDGIDREVESLRKQATELQDKRDQLHTRIDLLRTDFLTSHVDELDPDEIDFHLKRVSDRLNTVDVNVKTHRDDFQIESIHHINNLIDEIIRFNDPIEKRRKCQEFLNSCTSSIQFSEEIVVIDKKFENHLLACTLDDQKKIRKRLEALLHYMMKQMVSEWGLAEEIEDMRLN